MKRESERAPRQTFEQTRAQVTRTQRRNQHRETEDCVSHERFARNRWPDFEHDYVRNSQHRRQQKQRGQEGEDEKQHAPTASQPAKVVEEDSVHAAF
jgi:hypothetical protein